MFEYPILPQTPIYSKEHKEIQDLLEKGNHNEAITSCLASPKFLNFDLFEDLLVFCVDDFASKQAIKQKDLVKFYRNTLSSEPIWEMIKYKMALLHIVKGDKAFYDNKWKDASDQYNIAYQISSDPVHDAYHLMALASFLQSQGDLSNALDQLNHAIEKVERQTDYDYIKTKQCEIRKLIGDSSGDLGCPEELDVPY